MKLCGTQDVLLLIAAGVLFGALLASEAACRALLPTLRSPEMDTIFELVGSNESSLVGAFSDAGAPAAPNPAPLLVPFHGACAAAACEAAHLAADGALDGTIGARGCDGAPAWHAEHACACDQPASSRVC